MTPEQEDRDELLRSSGQGFFDMPERGIWPHDSSYAGLCRGCGVRFAGPKRAPSCWHCQTDAQKAEWNARFEDPKDAALKRMADLGQEYDKAPSLTQEQCDEIRAASWSLQQWVTKELCKDRSMAAICEAILCEAQKISARGDNDG